MQVRPDEGQAYILIGEGEYHELVNVTRSGPLTLLVGPEIHYCINEQLIDQGDKYRGNLTNRLFRRHLMPQLVTSYRFGMMYTFRQGWMTLNPRS